VKEDFIVNGQEYKSLLIAGVDNMRFLR